MNLIAGFWLPLGLLAGASFSSDIDKSPNMAIESFSGSRSHSLRLKIIEFLQAYNYKDQVHCKSIHDERHKLAVLLNILDLV